MYTEENCTMSILCYYAFNLHTLFVPQTIALSCCHTQGSSLLVTRFLSNQNKIFIHNWQKYLHHTCKWFAMQYVWCLIDQLLHFCIYRKQKHVISIKQSLKSIKWQHIYFIHADEFAFWYSKMYLWFLVNQYWHVHEFQYHCVLSSKSLLCMHQNK